MEIIVENKDGHLNNLTVILVGRCKQVIKRGCHIQRMQIRRQSERIITLGRCKFSKILTK